MNGKASDLHMLNVIVADMSASLDFYRQLVRQHPFEV
jgi:hypothetical protein